MKCIYFKLTCVGTMHVGLVFNNFFLEQISLFSVLSSNTTITILSFPKQTLKSFISLVSTQLHSCLKVDSQKLKRRKLWENPLIHMKSNFYNIENIIEPWIYIKSKKPQTNQFYIKIPLTPKAKVPKNRVLFKLDCVHTKHELVNKGSTDARNNWSILKYAPRFFCVGNFILFSVFPLSVLLLKDASL